MYRRTDKQIDKQTNRQTNKQTDKQTDRQTTDRPADQLDEGQSWATIHNDIRYSLPCPWLRASVNSKSLPTVEEMRQSTKMSRTTSRYARDHSNFTNVDYKSEY